MAKPRLGERLIGLLLLAALLFSPVLLSLFAQSHRIAGLPLLVVYVFAAWAVVIALLARVARGGGGEDREG